MNIGRPISREFSFTLKTWKSLLASISASLTLHLAIFAALSLSAPTTPHSGATPSARLEAMITQQRLPANQLPEIDKKIPADSDPTELGEPRSEFENPLNQGEHDNFESGIVSIEKPALRFVREIDLDRVSDLSEDGYVEVEFLINPEGKVVNTILKRTDIPIEFFELVAQTFENAEFYPGKRDGVPVFDKLRFRVVFSKSTPH